MWLTKWFKHILYSLFVFLTPIHSIIFSVALIVIIDTIFGIIRSNKLKIPFTSRRFYAFFKKTLVYQSVIVLTFFLDKSLINEFSTLFISVDFLMTKLIAGSICFNEFKSIEENINITYKISVWDFVKSFMNFAKNTKEGINEMKP